MKKILVHLHLYYPEQTDLLLDKLQSTGNYPYDFFVTMVESNDAVKQKIKSFNPNTKIVITKNVGADIWPFVYILNSVNLDDYEYIIKLHTKRDVKNHYFLKTGFPTHGNYWHTLLLNFLSPPNFEKTMDAFKNDKKLGMVADFRVIYQKPYKKNKRLTAKTKELLIQQGYPGKISYVCGTMFMARAQPFAVIQKMQWTENDFNVFNSTISNDRIEYVMEQFFGSLIVAQGYELRDVWTSGLRRFFLKLLWHPLYIGRKILRLICDPVFRIKIQGNVRIVKLFNIPVYKYTV